MAISEFTSRLGSVGRRQAFHAVTLSGGAAAFDVPFHGINMIQVSESASSASGEKFSALVGSTVNGRTPIAIDSSNGASTATVYVYVVGY